MAPVLAFECNVCDAVITQTALPDVSAKLDCGCDDAIEEEGGHTFRPGIEIHRSQFF